MSPVSDGTHDFLDGYCSTVQGLLDWFEVDLGLTELLFIQIDFFYSVFFIQFCFQMYRQRVSRQ